MVATIIGCPFETISHSPQSHPPPALHIVYSYQLRGVMVPQCRAAPRARALLPGHEPEPEYGLDCTTRLPLLRAVSAASCPLPPCPARAPGESVSSSYYTATTKSSFSARRTSSSTTTVLYSVPSTTQLHRASARSSGSSSSAAPARTQRTTHHLDPNMAPPHRFLLLIRRTANPSPSCSRCRRKTACTSPATLFPSSSAA
ncbi:hypothetical protein B0H16DRAFT_1553408 [Mycena metata]|uniref:Uncharacterized protein n=1 Tax=Mycena metata TaxID=1033252 RepID=A0AAD7N734_9AGAR|nr:hypothetical protein B0H16DRAFT_1553408 [Mycena metata]